MKTLAEHWERLMVALFRRQYIVVVSTIMFLLIVGIAGVLIYQDAWVLRDQINGLFNKQQLILARQTSHQIATALDDIRLEVEELCRFVGEMPESSWGSELSAAHRRLQSKGVLTACIHTAEGQLLCHPSQDPLCPLRDPGRAEEIDASAGVQLGRLCQRSDRGGRPGAIVGEVLCATPYGDGKRATLRVAVDVTRLVEGKACDVRSGRTGYAWVLSSEGTFLYHPEEAFIGEDAFTVREQREPDLSFDRINSLMKNRMLEGQEGTSIYVSGWHRGHSGEIDKLIAFTPIRSEALPPGRTWSVAVVAPTSEVAATLGPMYTRHYMAGGAIVVGVVLFGLLLGTYQYRASEALKQQVRLTKASLEETERMTSRIVEQATDLIYIFDLEMRVVMVNPHAVAVFRHLILTQSEGGVLPDDVDLGDVRVWLGHRLDDLMGPHDAGFMRRKIDQVLASGESIAYEHTIPIEGRPARLSTKLVPIRDETDRVRYLLGISRDITEQAEMDRRMYNTEKLASIGTLAAGVAHEINNPLAIILGFTDLLLERFEPGSAEYDDLKTIETNANNAKQIVENMLTFARVTEGMEDTVDVHESVQAVLRILSKVLGKRDVEVVSDLPAPLPKVRGDRREFQQVIFNLINNAMAAMEGGGTLTLSARASDGWVHLDVTDTGEGIPERIQPNIFDPFFTTKKVGEGTGLGLSLCYGIVSKYGGTMTFSTVAAEDHPDSASGTTFTVSMPVDEPASKPQGAT